jgi:hypothetical protein
MATKQEIKEVSFFLGEYDEEFVTDSVIEKEVPSILHRKLDESDPLVFHVNAVCREAGLRGGVEERGSDGCWLVLEELPEHVQS